MVVEALCRMGFGEVESGWLRPRLDNALPHPAAKTYIHNGNWQGYLGKEDQVASWHGFFGREVAALELRELLEKWVPRLAPGYAGAATHGLLRTAHAARAFDNADTPQRRDELAQGLAYWAATYQPLPESPPDGITAKPLDAALAGIPLVPVDERQNNGSITAALRVLEGRADFAPLIHAFDLGDDPRTACLDQVEALGPVFLAQAVDPLSTIVFTHGITSLMASPFLSGLLSRTTRQPPARPGLKAESGLTARYHGTHIARHHSHARQQVAC